MQNKLCEDCKGQLEQGVILDYTHGSILGERFAKVDDLPRGKKNIIWITESDFKDIRRVITYRCIKCNRLYSYASDEIIAKAAVSNVTKNTFTIIFLILILLIIIPFIIMVVNPNF